MLSQSESESEAIIKKIVSVKISSKSFEKKKFSFFGIFSFSGG